MRDRAVLCGSASKAYAMTGWRCGWRSGRPAVIAACNAMQSHSTSNVSSITQKAVDRGAERPAGRASRRCSTSTAAGAISCATGCRPIRASGCVKPAGAFYLFPDVSDPVAGRHPHLGRARAGAARRGARGGDAWRSVRRARLLPASRTPPRCRSCERGTERHPGLRASRWRAGKPSRRDRAGSRRRCFSPRSTPDRRRRVTSGPTTTSRARLRHRRAEARPSRRHRRAARRHR